MTEVGRNSTRFHTSSHTLTCTLIVCQQTLATKLVAQPLVRS